MRLISNNTNFSTTNSSKTYNNIFSKIFFFPCTWGYKRRGREAAAQLPRIAIQKPEKIIGDSTVAAMQTGVFWGYIDLIDGLVKRVKAEYGQPMTVIATGGVASLFEGASATIDHYDQTLMESGLLEIYRRNRKGPDAQ